MDVIEDKVKELVKGPLTESMSEEQKEHEKYGVWWAVGRLERAACELYSDGDMDFDTAITNLIAALGKLKGKEKELKKAYAADRKKEGPGPTMG